MKTKQKVFDYRALRLSLGIIAFALPIVVSLVARVELPSISASYHSAARDVFVGLLFIVVSFLWAYNGHTLTEARLSKLAAIGALVTALSPTACNTCVVDWRSNLHYIGAASLFLILTYFCYGPFQERTKGQGGKRERRSRIYLASGTVMLLCIITMGLAKFTLPTETVQTLRLTYWAEAIALWAFGVAWITSGKVLSPLVEADEVLKLKLL